MVIAIMIILLLVGVAVVGALYSSFLAFYVSFGDTLEYNKAYYAAISALERAELVLRYREPGYEGSGGRLGTSTYGSNVDQRPSNFGYFSGEDNGIHWNIASKTKRIPTLGLGNVEWSLISGNDNLNYNTLDYLNAENFIFSLDTSTGSPYTGGTISRSDATSFTGMIRLPPSLTGKFGGLDTTPATDIGVDGVYDDPMVDRSFRGKYGGKDFQVMPTVDILYTTPRDIQENDTVIREKRINTASLLSFGNGQNPFTSSNLSKGLTVISEKEADLTGKNFFRLLSGATGVVFRLSLLNLLTSKSKQIYPYLEYQFTFSKDIADRFYRINATGKYGKYEVKLFVQKPTIKESILGSFTVIF